MYDSNISIDLTTVAQKLSQDEDIIREGGAYYLSKLTDNVTSTAHINTHIEIVIEMYKKREAYKALKIAENNCLDNESVAIDLLSDLNSQLIGLLEYGNLYEKSITNGELLGFNTGFQELNQTIAGWCKPDLCIIAARPGAGKTAMMLSSVYHLAILNNVPTAIFSLEMSSEQLVERLESITSQVPLKRLRTNNLNDYERKLLLKTVSHNSELRLLF
jgi:replicative DNA helicase